MRKLATLLAATLLFATVASGQIYFGAKAGLNFNKLNDITFSSKVGNLKASWESRTGFHFGALCQIKLPVVGLALQPELLFISESTKLDLGELNNLPNMDKKSSLSISYIQLPVNIQWGFDMIMIRPFVMLSPYISYAVSKGGDLLKDIEWKDLNRFDYGVGVGAGIDIWKLQISGKYNWSFGTLASFKDDSADWHATIKGGKMRGFTLSVAYIF